MMVGRKCTPVECAGAGYGEDPMMAQCFKQMAKLQSVSASKPLPKKIEEAKKQKDLTSMRRYMDKLSTSLMCNSDAFSLGKASYITKLWQDLDQMDRERPTLGVFWLELYIDKYVGRGLPQGRFGQVLGY